MKNQIFKNAEFGPIRTYVVDGETYFVGKDVASALGYVHPTKAVTTHVDEEDRIMTETVTVQGLRQTNIINESGLYSLILSSKLESARRFKRWVTSEVLPAIRRNGRYELEQQNRLLESRNALLEEISAQQKPLTDYARNILSSTQTVTITQIAQDYGFSAVRFNELLMRLRIQHKVGGQWILYSPYLTKGYVQSFSSYFVMSDGEVQVKVHTRWTQSGRLFLYEELKKAGLLPLIELD
ncbi:MAG: phage antirepressor KilAC domain-containing protein [Bacteroidaceae bacterium]|jgi:prophage antirepressor-like protein|nr:phage antirepressor KilAC domain-containing protein [Bacteroidaceae bacterium]